MGEPCTFAIHRTPTGYLIRIVGRGTLHESPAVQDFVCGALRDRADIVLDLSACEYLDSTFLGCLVILHQRSKDTGGSFAVLADELVRGKLLHTARLDRLLPLADRRPECIGDPVTLHVSNLERAEFCRRLLEAHRALAELGGATEEAFRGVAEQLAKELDDISS